MNNDNSSEVAELKKKLSSAENPEQQARRLLELGVLTKKKRYLEQAACLAEKPGFRCAHVILHGLVSADDAFSERARKLARKLVADERHEVFWDLFVKEQAAPSPSRNLAERLCDLAESMEALGMDREPELDWERRETMIERIAHLARVLFSVGPRPLFGDKRNGLQGVLKGYIAEMLKRMEGDWPPHLAEAYAAYGIDGHDWRHLDTARGIAKKLRDPQMRMHAFSGIFERTNERQDIQSYLRSALCFYKKYKGKPLKNLMGDPAEELANVVEKFVEVGWVEAAEQVVENEMPRRERSELYFVIARHFELYGDSARAGKLIQRFANRVRPIYRKEFKKMARRIRSSTAS